jgi:plastocyanin
MSSTGTTPPYQFSPSTLAIGCGDSVTVTNNTTAPHTWSPTSGGFTGSGTMGPTAMYSYTFRSKGTFGFVCSIHSYMTGSVTVS